MTWLDYGRRHILTGTVAALVVEHAENDELRRAASNLLADARAAAVVGESINRASAEVVT